MSVLERSFSKWAALPGLHFLSPGAPATLSQADREGFLNCQKLAFEGAREVAGRAHAIAPALSAARAGGVVLLAGKGHEQGQIVGKDVLPFDDADVARSVAAGLA